MANKILLGCKTNTIFWSNRFKQIILCLNLFGRYILWGLIVLCPCLVGTYFEGVVLCLCLVSTCAHTFEFSFFLVSTEYIYFVILAKYNSNHQSVFIFQNYLLVPSKKALPLCKSSGPNSIRCFVVFDVAVSLLWLYSYGTEKHHMFSACCHDKLIFGL